MDNLNDSKRQKNKKETASKTGGTYNKENALHLTGHMIGTPTA